MSSQTKAQAQAGATASAKSAVPAKRSPKVPAKNSATTPPAISTPRLLSIWRAVCVTAIILVTAVMAIGLNRWTAHLAELSPQKNVLIHLQIVQEEVQEAVNSVPDLALVQQHLETANQNLNQVGGVTNIRDLDQVSTQLIAITIKATVASESPGDETTRELSEAHEKLVALLDSGISQAQNALQSGLVLNRIPVALLTVVALLLLVGASVVTAKRTRRILNSGLALAMVGIVLAWYLTDQAIASSMAVLVDPAPSDSLFHSKIDELNIVTLTVSALGLASAIAAAYGLRSRIKEFR